MHSIKFYLKEKMPLIILYGVCLFLGFFLIIYSVFSFYEGIDSTMVRYLTRSILLIPAIIIYIIDLIKYLLAVFDYKKQNITQKTLYILEQDFKKCRDEFNGVYQVLICSETKKGKQLKLWYYNQDLIYDIKVGKKYVIEYYKNSKCIYRIEPLFKTEAKKKKKVETSLNYSFNDVYIDSELFDKNQNRRSTITAYLSAFFLPFTILILIKLWAIKDIVDNFIIIFGLVLVSFIVLHILLFYKFIYTKISNRRNGKNVLIKDKITVRGIPVEKEFSHPHRKGYYLKTISANGKNLDLFFFSTDILCLGDLKERPGYKGYGNFIGTKYEVEYYKVSRVIKSMKLISQPYCTGDGSLC